mmetsp:Transcript_60528/g.169645  ORF Transcript_60528/g.169645 Transcript_60528/m.169645 type:complete len:386 (-) Transcript_60528:452-1609(-)
MARVSDEIGLRCTHGCQLQLERGVPLQREVGRGEHGLPRLVAALLPHSQVLLAALRDEQAARAWRPRPCRARHLHDQRVFLAVAGEVEEPLVLRRGVARCRLCPALGLRGGSKLLSETHAAGCREHDRAGFGDLRLLHGLPLYLLRGGRVLREQEAPPPEQLPVHMHPRMHDRGDDCLLRAPSGRLQRLRQSSVGDRLGVVPMCGSARHGCGLWEDGLALLAHNQRHGAHVHLQLSAPGVVHRGAAPPRAHEPWRRAPLEALDRGLARRWHERSHRVVEVDRRVRGRGDMADAGDRLGELLLGEGRRGGFGTSWRPSTSGDPEVQVQVVVVAQGEARLALPQVEFSREGLHAPRGHPGMRLEHDAPRLRRSPALLRREGQGRRRS